MKMLRKTIKAVVIIALLKIVVLVLDRISPASSVFHTQFLFSIQLLVIVWLILSLLLVIFKADKSWVARFLPVLMVMFVLVVDILFTYWMENPGKVPRFLMNEFKRYYASFERNVMAYEPCTVYDSVYSYKFIPGLAFSFGNTEYKNNYVVNSESLRDEESATMGPEIICAGNGYTLGVGVDQHNDYPHLLEERLERPVLNAANPAYGTAREMKRVVNLDTSITQYLVVQYSKYDVYENAAFVNSNDSLKITSDSAYKQTLKEYRWRKEYFPGKYAMTIGYNFLKTKLNKLRKKKYYLSGDAAASANYFLQVIDKNNFSDRVRIVVTEINDFNDMDSGFLPAVDSLVQLPQFSRLKGRVKTVNVAPVLTRDDYYIIDPNLRSSGQQKVADKIAEVIAGDSTLQRSGK
jgi:hypothetical protein